MLHQYFKSTKPIVQLVFFLIISVLSYILFFFISTIGSYILFGIENTLQGFSPSNIGSITSRYIQSASQIGLFLIPPCIFSKIFYGSYFGYFPLSLKKVSGSLIVLFILLLLTSSPLIELLKFLNQQISFPNSLKHMEEYFRNLSVANDLYGKQLFADKSTANFLGNVFVLCLLPAVSEELFFRGVLQQFCIKWIKKPHLGVILLAILFSIVRFDFYYFLPQLFFGLILGYSFYYTKSLTIPIILHFTNNLADILNQTYYENNSIVKDYNWSTYIATFVFLVVFVLLILSIRKQLKIGGDQN